ncbi:MAG TPA: L-threonylcarbamoyladenylate synthase [Myxococcaceae bacterium]|nr:L-threonylcarbamoyladenylate synthase [Myxococcaceae bacterium]
MTAPLVPVDGQHPQPRTVGLAVQALQDGELLGYPSDTTYALGCDAHQRRAVERLAQLKHRDPKKPFALLVADLSDLARYAQVSNFAYRVLRQLAPGPFTFVLPATRLVPELLLHRKREVGLRIPDAPVARALVTGLGGPLVTTTATALEELLDGGRGRSTRVEGEPLTDAAEVRDVYGHALAQVLDAGPLEGHPSTVLSLMGDSIEVLRQGVGVVAGL